jgi:hypothetical protein
MGAPVGNKNATKNKVWIQALNRAVAQDDGVRLRAAAEKLIDLAVAGDVAALRELGDRLDGKVAQQVLLGGDGSGDPLIVQVVKFADTPTE